MDVQSAKQQVIRAGKELSETGLISRTWGNVSCLLDKDYFAISASGRNYMTLTEDEVIPVKLSDLSYAGSVVPSSEIKVHQAVYQMREGTGFVIHTHQDNASAVSAMNIDWVTFNKEWPGLGKRVFCAEYGLPGSKKLWRSTLRALALSSGNAIILRNHGAVCWGRNYEEAFQAAYDLEKACGEYLANLNSEILSANKGDTEQVGSKVILNRSQILLDFAELTDEMRPYLDDFAQIVGPSMKVLPKDQDLAEQEAARGRSIIVRGVGAFCTARNLSDVQAISQIVEKNAMAFFAASITGAKPIKNLDCMRMRQRYLHQYAKLAKK